MSTPKGPPRTGSGNMARDSSANSHAHPCRGSGPAQADFLGNHQEGGIFYFTLRGC